MVKIKTYQKDDIISGSEVYAKFSKRVSVGDQSNDYYSWEETNIRISVGEDGSLCFSDYGKEGFAYIYPDQLEHVKEALEEAFKQRLEKLESEQ